MNLFQLWYISGLTPFIGVIHFLKGFFSDMFGMGAASHKLTHAELATIAEINSTGPPQLDKVQEKTDVSMDLDFGTLGESATSYFQDLLLLH